MSKRVLSRKVRIKDPKKVLSKAEEAKVVRNVIELTDEVPAHVRARIDEQVTEQREADAYRKGFQSAQETAAAVLEEQFHKMNAIEVQHKAAQVHLIHTFASVIFMLGKSEVERKTTDA